MKSQIINTVNGDNYEIEVAKLAGEVAMTCPACSEQRAKKRDKCLQWNVEKGVGKCFHCDATFINKTNNNATWGNATWGNKTNKTNAATFEQRSERVYQRPKWGNKTELTDDAVKWFEGRAITQKTLKEMKISSDIHFVPQVNKERNVVCFPYFKGLQLVNCKYRDGAKNFVLEKNAELIFYNFDAIDKNKTIIITEGEIDALSFMEAGMKNVVSVPNGAGAKELAYLDNYFDHFEHIEKFYIATDFDAKGLQLRDELVRRFGAQKCYIVTYQGCKDANELLQSKGFLALREAIETARELPIESLVDLNNQYDSIYNYYQNGLPKGFGLGIEAFDRLCRWDAGMIVPVTGVPSHGKSEMLDFIVARLNTVNGWKIAFYSPENNPVTIHYSKIATKIAGAFMREHKTSKEVFDKTFEYVEQNFFWIDPDQNAVASTLLNQVEQLIQRKGIKVLVLDPFNCIDLEQGKNNKSETETQAIGRFLYELQRFARRNKVLIFIVAHPAKPMQPQKINDNAEKKYPIMTLYDIAGSAHWYNRADIGIVVHRDFVNGSTTLIFQKVRFSNLGSTGQLQLQYNPNNGRFHLPFCPDESNWLAPALAAEAAAAEPAAAEASPAEPEPEAAAAEPEPKASPEPEPAEAAEPEAEASPEPAAAEASPAHA